MIEPCGPALRHLRSQLFGDSPARLAELEEARASAELADLIRAMRIEAGLTQRELARMIGTGPAVVCRLENDEYRGSGLAMLRRVALVLGRRVEIRLVSGEDG